MGKKKKENLIDSLNAGDWSFSDERQFMENLYVGRFNYFLVVFSLFITAGFANSFESYKYIVFFVGALILFLVWLPLYRGYKKHDRIMKIMFNNMPDHPAFIIERIMRSEGYKPRYRVSRYMGIYIPWACITLLVIIGFSILIGILH